MNFLPLDRKRWPVCLRLAVLLGAGILIFALPIQAGDKPDYLFDHVGKWEYTLNLKDFGTPASYFMTPAEQEQFKAKLAKLAEILHATPMLNPPRGIDAIAEAHGTGPDDDSDGRQPPARTQRIMSALHLKLHTHFMQDDGKVGVSLFPAAIVFDLNSLPATLQFAWAYEGVKDEKGRDIYVMPAECRKLGGFPLYYNGVMVITRGDRPYWVPVSREQCLRALIKRSSEPDESGGGPYPMVLDMFKKELAALSPEQRQAPAYTGGGKENLSGLCDADVEGARPLVVCNQDYFDPKLPRTAVQMITIYWNFGMRWDDFAEPILAQDGHGPSAVRAYELMESLDYRNIASLLDMGGR